LGTPFENVAFTFIRNCTYACTKSNCGFDVIYMCVRGVRPYGNVNEICLFCFRFTYAEFRKSPWDRVYTGNRATFVRIVYNRPRGQLIRILKSLLFFYTRDSYVVIYAQRL